MGKDHTGTMTSLRKTLAFNIKEHRRILGLTQSQLAEKVKTSANYIALIETKKKFPKPEMLERIAASLEIDAPALFAVEICPLAEAETFIKAQKLLASDLSQFLSKRVKQLTQNEQPLYDQIPQDDYYGLAADSGARKPPKPKR